MRYVISIFTIVLTVLLTSVPVSAQGLDLGELLGGALGGYGAAKLCGKGPATAVACGYVGSQLGSELLSGRGNYNPQYGQQQYGQPQYSQRRHIPRRRHVRQQQRNCHQIAILMPDGRPAIGVACMNTQGYWVIVGSR